MMQRTRTVLEKLIQLAQRNNDRTVIDVDLMLDYTRVLYADLLEIRSRMSPGPDLHIDEPTLDELTASMAVMEEEDEHQDIKAYEPQNAGRIPDSVTVTPVPPVPVVAQERDIRRFIDLNEKYQFLSELFRNDVQAYEEAMKAINSLQTEEEALQWVGLKRWQEHNETAEAFRNVLKRFYAGS